MFARGLEQLHCYLWGLVFRNKPVAYKRGSCFANAFGFYSKHRIVFGFWFCFCFLLLMVLFLVVCLIGECRRKRNIPENPACTNSIRVKLVLSKCHIYLRFYFFPKHSVTAKKMPWSEFFLGRLSDWSIKYAYWNRSGALHLIRSFLRQLWFGVN